MGLNEGIHDTISDEIYVQTDDIRVCAVTTDCLKDSAVTTAKLAGGTIATTNISPAAGHTFTVAITGGGTVSSRTTLFLATASITVFWAGLYITAVGTSGTVTIEGTASDALLVGYEGSGSVSAPECITNVTAAGTCRCLDVTAGNSIVAKYTTGSTTAAIRGKFVMQYITTPT